MEVITREYMNKPNLCLMCEQTPDPGARVIDTLRDLNIGGVPATADQEAMDLQTHLSGRKYICEACVTDFAKRFDWTPPEDVESLTSELSDTIEELEALRKETAPFRELAEALTKIREPDAAEV